MANLYIIAGCNGAGKTTTIKALVGALRPTSGTISVLGHDPLKDRWTIRKKIGYMPQEPALYDDLSALENVLFYARLHHIAEPRSRAVTLLTELDLGERLQSAVHTLSGGMQKRVALACALIHDPELLLLDEPTSALDPLLKRQLWERFRKLAAQSRTLVVSTHQMDEAMLCDTVVVMDHGRVIAYDQPRKLIARGQANINFQGSQKTWTEKIPADGPAIAAALHHHGLSSDINSLTMEGDNLEDVMVKLIKEGKA